MLQRLIFYIKNILNFSNLEEKNNQILINIAGLYFENRKINGSNYFCDYEHKVFSQFGEDGLINFVLDNINIKNKYFIEFGVENYEEANTKLLLEGFNWAGTIFDCEARYISAIKRKNSYWKYNLSAINKYITAENVNSVLKKNCDLDRASLLSIDVDGNDYWIWKAIDCINPEIVIVEYNSIFGSKDSVTIPYNSNFNRKKYHYSNSYFGASLHALYKLGLQKNYILVGTNVNGNNAFFVKKDCLKKQSLLKERTPQECFNESTFKEARDKKGNILEIDKNKIREEIFQLPLIEV